MKESNAYHMAAIAVMKSHDIAEQDKLDVLRVLLEKEDLALYIEKQKEQEKENG